MAAILKTLATLFGSVNETTPNNIGTIIEETTTGLALVESGTGSNLLETE